MNKTIAINAQNKSFECFIKNYKVTRFRSRENVQIINIKFIWHQQIKHNLWFAK